MKLITSMVMLVAMVSYGLAAGINWNTDLEKALKIAKKTHKPVMIDFYGEH
jgi:hypothetical protein